MNKLNDSRMSDEHLDFNVQGDKEFKDSIKKLSLIEQQKLTLKHIDNLHQNEIHQLEIEFEQRQLTQNKDFIDRENELQERFESKLKELQFTVQLKQSKIEQLQKTIQDQLLQNQSYKNDFDKTLFTIQSNNTLLQTQILEQKLQCERKVKEVTDSFKAKNQEQSITLKQQEYYKNLYEESEREKEIQLQNESNAIFYSSETHNSHNVKAIKNQLNQAQQEIKKIKFESQFKMTRSIKKKETHILQRENILQDQSQYYKDTIDQKNIRINELINEIKTQRQKNSDDYALQDKLFEKQKEQLKIDFEQQIQQLQQKIKEKEHEQRYLQQENAQLKNKFEDKDIFIADKDLFIRQCKEKLISREEEIIEKDKKLQDLQAEYDDLHLKYKPLADNLNKSELKLHKKTILVDELKVLISHIRLQHEQDFIVVKKECDQRIVECNFEKTNLSYLTIQLKKDNEIFERDFKHLKLDNKRLQQDYQKLQIRMNNNKSRQNSFSQIQLPKDRKSPLEIIQSQSDLELIEGFQKLGSEKKSPQLTKIKKKSRIIEDDDDYQESQDYDNDIDNDNDNDELNELNESKLQDQENDLNDNKDLENNDSQSDDDERGEILLQKLTKQRDSQINM